MKNSCDCSSPRPMYSIRHGYRICQICLLKVQPLRSKLPPPDYTPVCAIGVTAQINSYSYQCPYCERFGAYFPTSRDPVGEVTCECCKQRVTGDQAQAFSLQEEIAYHKRIEGTMDHTLSLLHPKPPKDSEEE
jgi:hypothetical protein